MSEKESYLSTLLLLIIIVIFLSVNSLAEPTPEMQESVILNKDQPSPYYGVLLPPDTYRDYNFKVDRYAELVGEIQTCAHEPAPAPQWQAMGMAFLVGVIAGMIAH